MKPQIVVARTRGAPSRFAPDTGQPTFEPSFWDCGL